jgi:hypothetical protein
MNKLEIGWFKNGIIALAIAGLYAIILVLLRTPSLAFLLDKDPQIFKCALVIHVNLSILVWLLSIVATIWSRYVKVIYLGTIYRNIALLGTICISISPILGQTNAIMNNYIPMLDNIIFVIGISLFGTALLIFACNVTIILCFHYKQYKNDLYHFTALSSSIMFILIWICFALSYFELSKITQLMPLNIELYYELLYLSGGHLLQFLFCQIAILIWTILFAHFLGRSLRCYKVCFYLLILNFIFCIMGLSGHFLYQITSVEFKEFYTLHMKYIGSVIPTLSLMIIICDCLKRKINISASYIKASIICSCLLFIYGNIIGSLISSANVTVPTHYHGAIVGISVAFIGFVYLSIISDKSPYPAWQIYIVTIGQFLHISGLAISGEYGLLGKTTSHEAEISTKFYIAIMEAGELIAIIGGLMFVYICSKKLYKTIYERI